MLNSNKYSHPIQNEALLRLVILMYPTRHTCQLFAGSLLLVYTFIKADIPEEEEQLVSFTEKLFMFGVSLDDYKRAFEMPNITAYVP